MFMNSLRISADLMIREDLTTSNLLLAAEEQRFKDKAPGLFRKNSFQLSGKCQVSVRTARVRLRRALFDLRL